MLALQFIADGWSIKKLIKRIVSSNVYQLDSKFEERNDLLDLVRSLNASKLTREKQDPQVEGFIESGVRFVEINHGDWDHHFNIGEVLPASCAAVDLPLGGLLTDLKSRGLLEDTLVIWGGEFGRTPHAEGRDGRDHNVGAFTVWMAACGVKAGTRYGVTDVYGYDAVDGKVSIHDWHATILHLLGLDHEKFTCRHAGRDFRLTDVHGRVVEEIVA